MNTTIEFLQTKLRRRHARILECDPLHLRFALAQAWTFLHSERIISSLLSELEARQSRLVQDGEIIGDLAELPQAFRSNKLATEEMLVGYGYGVWRGLHRFDYKNLRAYETTFYGQPIGGAKSEYESCARLKRHVFNIIFDYLHEQMDQQTSLFHQLLRYKTRCECFDYLRLAKLINEEQSSETARRRLEKLLQGDLYRYLHDQGVDFSIEPKLDEDMIDILASVANSPHPVLIETKVVKEKKRRTIRDGYNQIVTYAKRYQSNVAYLAVYNLLQHHIVFDLDQDQPAFRYLDEGGIRIYFLVIDLPIERVPASSLGRYEALTINREHLIGSDGAAEPEA